MKNISIEYIKNLGKNDNNGINPVQLIKLYLNENTNHKFKPEIASSITWSYLYEEDANNFIIEQAFKKEFILDSTIQMVRKTIKKIIYN